MMLSLSPDAIRSLWTTLVGDSVDSAVFVGECFFHAVEALVAVEEVEGIDPMPLFTLRAFEFAQPATVEQLDGVLHLGRQVIRQLLTGLAADGLVAESAATFRLTDAGSGTLRTGRIVKHVEDRRQFYFLHPAMEYVAVHNPRGNVLSDLAPSRVPEPWTFDAALLESAIAQPAEWKRSHHFPHAIAQVITRPTSANPEVREESPQDALVTCRTKEDMDKASKLLKHWRHIVVDKAQVVVCAVVIRMSGEDANDLAAYPVAAHGSLVGGRGQPLFCLRNSGDIDQAFPGLWSVPAPDKVTETWRTFAARHMLSEPDLASVRFEQDRLIVTLDSGLIEAWSAFVSLAVQDQLRWYVAIGPLCRLCPVVVEGGDVLAAEQLQALRAILRLEQVPERVAIIRDGSRLQSWITEQGLATCPSPRMLANMAFRFGRYRLAYELSELEDMSDAAV